MTKCDIDLEHFTYRLNTDNICGELFQYPLRGSRDKGDTNCETDRQVLQNIYSSHIYLFLFVWLFLRYLRGSLFDIIFYKALKDGIIGFFLNVIFYILWET